MLYYFEWNYYTQPMVKEWSVTFQFFRIRVSYKDIWNSIWRWVHSSHLFLLLFTHEYIYNFNYNLALLYLLHCSNCSSFSYCGLFRLVHFFLAFSYILTLQDSPGSFCIFPALSLKTAFSPENFSYFHWWKASEIMI